MSKYRALIRIILITIFSFVANSFYLMKENLWLIPIVILLFFFVNTFSGFLDFTIKRWRLKICNHGVECLSVFYMSLIISMIYHIVIIFALPWDWVSYLLSALICAITHTILFWNGIICVYCTSAQLGIKPRIIGAICGPIPVAHLFALGYIIYITSREVVEETKKDWLNDGRVHLQICKTKYPILLVHGVFFRDSKTLNYWGRVPAELIKNGATLYYGEHHSASSVEESALEISEKIKGIIEKYGYEKINIIAHSKGGLDCRYAIEKLGVAPYIASFTTINTPHKGCGFAEYILNKSSEKLKNKVANTYNKAAKKMGDTNPDFLAAVGDLTESACEKFNAEIPTPEGIYCQSFGSVLSHAIHGRFPLNFSYPLVKHFDGENDGLVASDAFAFGESFTLLATKGRRGISHADMIDLNRENIPDFDVREFYVQLVSRLREKGF